MPSIGSASHRASALPPRQTSVQTSQPVRRVHPDTSDAVHFSAQPQQRPGPAHPVPGWFHPLVAMVLAPRKRSRAEFEAGLPADAPQPPMPPAKKMKTQ